jgi:hypothetical protein
MMASKGFYDTSLLLQERNKIYKLYDLLADDTGLTPSFWTRAN